MSAVSSIISEIEVEMRKIGFWREQPPMKFDHTKLYSEVSFEEWLQFVFIPKVRSAADSGDFSEIPPYRIGVAALRQYDYHSIIPEASALTKLCFDLESELAKVCVRSSPL